MTRKSATIVASISFLFLVAFLFMISTGVHNNNLIFASDNASLRSNNNVTVVVYINGTEVLTIRGHELPVVCGVDWINLGDPKQPMNC